MVGPLHPVKFNTGRVLWGGDCISVFFTAVEAGAIVCEFVASVTAEFSLLKASVTAEFSLSLDSPFAFQFAAGSGSRFRILDKRLCCSIEALLEERMPSRLLWPVLPIISCSSTSF